jgi:hypothetical protein
MWLLYHRRGNTSNEAWNSIENSVSGQKSGFFFKKLKAG